MFLRQVNFKAIKIIFNFTNTDFPLTRIIIYKKNDCASTLHLSPYHFSSPCSEEIDSMHPRALQIVTGENKIKNRPISLLYTLLLLYASTYGRLLVQGDYYYLFPVLFEVKREDGKTHMGLSCYKSHCKVYVNVLVYTLHMFPNKYHYNLISVDMVHGICQVNIDCPV